MLHQGSRFSSLIILYAIFSLSSLMLKSEGTEHIVGDSNGWELFTNYTNWTQGREFHVGDVLGNFSNSCTTMPKYSRTNVAIPYILSHQKRRWFMSILPLFFSSLLFHIN